MGNKTSRKRNKNGRPRRLVLALLTSVVLTSACDHIGRPGPLTTEAQLHVLILRANQGLCAQTAGAMVWSWRDSIFQGKGSYFEFPDSLALQVGHKSDQIKARIEYLQKSLERLHDELSPPAEKALTELQTFHEASCRGVIEEAKSFHTLKSVASHGTDGFDVAWSKHQELLDVSADDAARLQAQVDERLAEIDRGAATRAREARQDRLQAERERLDVEDREWQRFLEAKERRREREAARLRALRERRFSDESAGDGGPQGQEHE